MAPTLVPRCTPPHATNYSPLDLLTAVTDAAGNQTAIAYDALGRKTGMTDPDMGTWSYAYDNAGNLLRQTDARGKSIFFAYDEIDRLTGKQYADSTTYPNPFVPDVSYSYDDTSGGNLGRGYRTGMLDSSGSTTWRYDARGRVVQEVKTVIGAGTFVTQWTYDARDRVATQTYPGGSGGEPGEVVTTSYGKWGQADALSGASAYVVAMSLTADGRADLVKLGGTAATPTLQIDYVYFPWTTSNGRGRLQQIKAGTPANPTLLQDLRYTYDAVGNIASIQDWKAGSPETQSFTYDHLDRLTGVSGAYSESYSYDAIGNLTSKAGVAYTYPASGAGSVRPHAVSAAGTSSFVYDANGNMTSRTVAGSTQTLTWDYENRLVTIAQGANVSTFVYDGDGNRVGATVNGVSTVYIGNYYEQTGSTIRTYYYHSGQRVAMREGGVTTWLFGDHLGSTSVAYCASDGQTVRQGYYAWGSLRPGPGNVLPTDYTFTGQKLDARSGLMYYVARWYDPYVGRFIGADSLVQTQTRSPDICLYLAVSYTDRDALAQWNQFNRWQRGADAQPHQLPYPLDPQFANRYTYARNSPLAYIDDSGHIAWWIVGGIAGAVVGFGAYALTHRDSFDWRQAALWTGGGAVVGATLGAGAQWVAGALAAETAATAGTAATFATTGAAAGSSASGRGLQVFSQAWKYGIDAYTRLAPRIAGTGLEVHHIIERRFALRLGLDERWIPSVALTPQEHQVFTQAWRGAIPYGIQEVTVEQVWYWAQRIYAGYPELLDAAFKTLFHQ